MSLSTETIEGTSLPFESIDYVHGGHSFPLGMLGVSDCISDNVLQENFQDTSSFFVDEPRDTFHSTTTSKTTNGRLGDSLNVIT